MTYKPNMTAKELVKKINSVKTRGKNLDMDIHKYAIEAICHALPQEMGGHGDLTLLTRLQMSLPNIARRNAFQTWVVNHIPVRWVKKEADGKITEGYKLDKKREDQKWYVAQADACPFWEFTLEPAPQGPYTAAKALATIKAAYTKVEKSLKEKAGDMTDEEKRAGEKFLKDFKAFAKSE